MHKDFFYCSTKRHTKKHLLLLFTLTKEQKRHQSYFFFSYFIHCRNWTEGMTWHPCLSTSTVVQILIHSQHRVGLMSSSKIKILPQKINK